MRGLVGLRDIASLKESIAYLRGTVEQMDRFSEFREYVDKRFNHVETELREEVRLENLEVDCGWIVGILLTMWVTVIVAILFK